MKIPQNTFRDALKAGKPQIGCWVGFASPDVAEDAELAESVSMAMLTVLETLGPTERYSREPAM